MNLKAAVTGLRIKKSDHPNKLPFSGVLLYLDSASQQAPHGSEGHRIYVSSEVAAKRLGTLVGMPLNYAPNGLDAHESDNAVGVVERAYIDGNKVVVEGSIWKKTFPRAEEDLHGKDLGMSMELAEVEIADKEDDIWRLNDFYFTGATALWPDSAAYTKTALAAAAAVVGVKKGDPMDKRKKTAQVGSGSANKAAVILATAITTAVSDKVQKAIEASQAPLLTAIGDLTKAVGTLKAGAAPPAATPEETAASELEAAIQAAGETATEEEEIDAAADDDDDDDDIDAAGEEVAAGDDEEDSDDDDDDDEEEMEGAGGSGDISDVNKGQTENKGSKTGTTGPAGGPSTDMRMSSKKNIKAMKAAATTIKKLKIDLQAANVKNRRLEKRVTTIEARAEAMEAQIEAAASRSNRRTITPELRSLLEKNGVDINAAQSGRKLTVSFVDKMFRDIGFNLDPEQRMAFKNMLLSSGMMENPTQSTN